MSGHRIRLRGPWRYQRLHPTATEDNPGRRGVIELPASPPTDWLDDGGGVILQRSFNWVIQLAAAERVALQILAPGAAWRVTLNGADLITTETLVPSQVDVSLLLRVHNQLVLHTEQPLTGIPLFEEVQLYVTGHPELA